MIGTCQHRSVAEECIGHQRSKMFETGSQREIEGRREAIEMLLQMLLVECHHLRHRHTLLRQQGIEMGMGEAVLPLLTDKIPDLLLKHRIYYPRPESPNTGNEVTFAFGEGHLHAIQQ